MVGSLRRFVTVTILYLACVAHGAPLVARVNNLQIHIIARDQRGISGGCDQTQVQYIMNGINTARFYALQAYNRLTGQFPTPAYMTRPFKTFFGDNTYIANPATIAQYYFRIADINPIITLVNGYDSDEDIRHGLYDDNAVLTIECSAYPDPDDPVALAKTTQYNPTLIQIFPAAWAPTTVHGDMNDARFWNGFAPPVGFDFAMTLYHELFHTYVLYNPSLGLPPLMDVAGRSSYGLPQVQNLVPNNKIWNAENYVWFSFILIARPNEFHFACPIALPIVPRSLQERAPPSGGAPPPPANGNTNSQRPGSPPPAPNGGTRPPPANGATGSSNSRPLSPPPPANGAAANRNPPNGRPGSPPLPPNGVIPPANGATANRNPPNGRPGSPPLPPNGAMPPPNGAPANGNPSNSRPGSPPLPPNGNSRPGSPPLPPNGGQMPPAANGLPANGNSSGQRPGSPPPTRPGSAQKLVLTRVKSDGQVYKPPVAKDAGQAPQCERQMTL